MNSLKVKQNNMKAYQIRILKGIHLKINGINMHKKLVLAGILSLTYFIKLIL
jgi:hypothetical protein